MKVLKGISLFFLYPLFLFALGVWIGVQTEHFFYPGPAETGLSVENDTDGNEIAVNELFEAEEKLSVKEVSAGEETLSADTEYVLREADVLRGTEVETVWELPKQYIGMNRERFVSAVQNYSDYPPLTELEQGFVNAEVVSFARARVVVRKSYQYIMPGDGFYLAVKDNEVVVYLEDKKTIYMNTGIMLETLPENVQKQIIQTMFVESEGDLYGFLESYSS
ncbi:MAG: hypothetical protein IJ716_15370 [Lachnospiraceae bacterium]|nr:hypothetical protein [Lachnospiraceae bacterium]